MLCIPRLSEIVSCRLPHLTGITLAFRFRTLRLTANVTTLSSHCGHTHTHTHTVDTHIFQYGSDKRENTSPAFDSCCLCESVEAHKAQLNGFRRSRGCRLSRSSSSRVQLSAIDRESSTVAPNTASTVELNTTSAVEFNTACTLEWNTASTVETSLRRNGDGLRRHASQKYVGVVLGSVR